MDIRGWLKSIVSNVIANLVAAVVIAVAVAIYAAAAQFSGPVILVLMFAVVAAVLSVLNAIKIPKTLGELTKRVVALEQSAPRGAPGAKPTWFESHGFRWEVLPNFASQWRLHPPDGPNESMLHNVLEHIFQGPYCPRGCGLPVGDDLRNDRRTCSRCGAPLRPDVEIKAEGPRDKNTSTASYDPLWPLRKAAYRDAVAALHEGEL